RPAARCRPPAAWKRCRPTSMRSCSSRCARRRPSAIPRSRRWPRTCAGSWRGGRWRRAAGTWATARGASSSATAGRSWRGARWRQRVAEERQAQLERITAFQRGVLETVDIDAMGYALAEAQREAVQAALGGASGQADARTLDAAFASVPATDIARDALDRYV